MRMNDELTSIRKPKSKDTAKLLIGNADDSFEVLLASDHDFDLFKHMRFSPSHEIWVKPELEDKETAVRRMLPKDIEIDKHAL